MLSEILPTLFGWHEEFRLDKMRRRGPFGQEGELEVSDNLVVLDVIFLFQDVSR
jgi:hypothetical protein